MNVTKSGWIGARLPRLEDTRLLGGGAEYLDDLDSEGAVHVAFVRSVYAHARVTRIDSRAAAAAPGVMTVATGTGLGADNGPFQHPLWRPNPSLLELLKPIVQPQTIELLVRDRARYAGEPVAAVVAADPYLAHDAASLVDIDYEPLDVVVDAEASLSPNAPLLYEEWGTNVATAFSVAKGDCEAAFASADKVVTGRFVFGRQTGAPIETRGVLARPNRRTGGVTVWSATQNPHWLRDALATSMRLHKDQIRVIAPDVGGAFGVKSMVYPEELLVPLLARKLGRAVKWVETRSEHFASAIHSRDHVHDIALALKADGTILGLQDRFVSNVGAASILPFVESYNTAAHISGPYRVPSLFVEGRAVVTNKTPAAPVRGAGRPEAVFAMERILDVAAQELGIEPVALRRRNTISSDEMPYAVGMPYRDGKPIVLDSGAYLECLDQALDAIGYADFRRNQEDERRRGRYVGIGIAAYTEGTGIGPMERASVSVDTDGRATVCIAVPSQGQSHETTMAQLVAEVLQIQPGDVRLVQGDTLSMPEGDATIASRTAVVVGNAVHLAARRVRDRALKAAAQLLNVEERDLELRDGMVRAVGSLPQRIRLGEIAAALKNPAPSSSSGRVAADTSPLSGWESGLDASAGFGPPTVTWANGVHAVIVEVDPDTGHVFIRRYVVVHDCGRVINPMVVDAQIAGGVVQGIGGALLEELVYDRSGQLTSGSFADYCVPRATDAPMIEVFHRESLSPLNPLGVKGVGEGGTIPVPAAIASAVEDALAPFHVRVTQCPLTPERVWQLLTAEQRAARGRA